MSASENSRPLLDVVNVSNAYTIRSHALFGKTQAKRVLDHVSLAIENGEVFGLVGESGCGKSTLANAILGLIDYKGSILLNGQPCDGRHRGRRARDVQAVFQDPSSALNPSKRVGWLLEEPLRIHGVARAERSRRVGEVLEMIGLNSSYQKRRADELSGGQKQRVCIGCALMLEPRLLIADEAVSALDVSVGAQILNLFKDLHERLGLSLLFISHNLDVVYYLCDRIAVMYEGRIVEMKDAEELYRDPTHPYTKALLDAIPQNIREQA
jgi:ABC-type glutathione transport system ATPase component